MLLPAGGVANNLTASMAQCFSLAVLFGCQLMENISYRRIADSNDHFWEVKERDEPAALSDPELGTHGYFQTENVKLHYVEKGNRSNPLMLFVHGYPEFWYSWRYQIKEFCDDYWVVAVDLRGYGKSEKPQGIEHYKADILAADIRDLIVGLGQKKVILVGHDWGGMLVYYLVLTYPEYVERYIIINSVHPYVMKEALETDHAQIKTSWYMCFYYMFAILPEEYNTMDDMAFLSNTIVSSNTPSSITAEDLECYKYTYGQPHAFTTAINLYRANLWLETSYKLLDKGNSSCFPKSIIIFGMKDKVLNLVQNKTAEMVANTKLVYIDTANHFSQQDDPEAVNKEIKKFLAEQETESICES